MNKLSQLILISAFLTPAFVLSLERSSEKNCGLAPYPMRIEARHIEGKGVGYNQGYTTLEGFFSLNPCFFDVRGHVFNDGKLAANAGIGYRLRDRRIWGANLYYDYRNTSHHTYNQISGGLESLGNIWDFRINGYFPIGRNKSHRYQTRFDYFKNHEMILKSKREFGMIGTNAEVGYHFKNMENVDLYAAAGPYYFGNEGKNAWGGEARLSGDFFKYLHLQVNASYDTVFKGIVQGLIGLTYRFGGKKEVRSSNCNRQMMLENRAMERVYRNEIIVVDRKHEHSVAINPATGLPYFFLFVDNTSSSNGTFESPYHTLATAVSNSKAGDVIYVFAGDGTATGLTGTFFMKDNQKLWGSGIDHQLTTSLGSIRVPAQSNGYPHLQGTSLAILVAANHCEISGFDIHPTAGVLGIVANPASTVPCSNLTVTQNIIHDGQIGIAAVKCPGTNVISDNSFSNLTVFGILLIDDTTQSSGVISNNTFNNCTTGSSIQSADPAGAQNYQVIGNTMTNCSTEAFRFNTGENGVSSLTIMNNTANSSGYGMRFLADTDVTSSYCVTNNTLLNNTTQDFSFASGTAGGSGTSCLSLKGNTTSIGFEIIQQSPATLQLDADNNMGTINESGTITIVPPGTCGCN